MIVIPRGSDQLAASDGDSGLMILEPGAEELQDPRHHRRLRAVLCIAAAVVAAPVVLLTGTGGGEQPSSPAQVAPSLLETPAPETISPTLRHVVQVVDARERAADVRFDPAQITVGKAISADAYRMSSVAVAFDPVSVDRDCIIRADLLLPNTAWDGADDIRVYPGAALSVADGQLPPNGDGAATLIDHRPFGTAARTMPGTAFDVTQIIRVWASGGLFPSRNRAIPYNSPVVLVVRPAAADYGEFTATWRLDDAKPELAVEVDTDCRRATAG